MLSCWTRCEGASQRGSGGYRMAIGVRIPAIPTRHTPPWPTTNTSASAVSNKDDMCKLADKPSLWSSWYLCESSGSISGWRLNGGATFRQMAPLSNFLLIGNLEAEAVELEHLLALGIGIGIGRSQLEVEAGARWRLLPGAGDTQGPPSMLEWFPWRNIWLREVLLNLEFQQETVVALLIWHSLSESICFICCNSDLMTIMQNNKLRHISWLYCVRPFNSDIFRYWTYHTKGLLIR